MIQNVPMKLVLIVLKTCKSYYCDNVTCDKCILQCQGCKRANCCNKFTECQNCKHLLCTAGYNSTTECPKKCISCAKNCSKCSLGIQDKNENFKCIENGTNFESKLDKLNLLFQDDSIF